MTKKPVAWADISDLREEYLDEEDEGKLMQRFILCPIIGGEEYVITFAVISNKECELTAQNSDGEYFIFAKFFENTITRLTKYWPENDHYILIGADLLEIGRQFYSRFGKELHGKWIEEFGHLIPDFA